MRLSIIIVSFNTRHLLSKCLQSLFSQISNSNDIEVIIVDNASNDDTIEYLENKYPQVKIIRNTENVGFGKANNQGVAQAKGEWVLFLNSDTKFRDIILNEVLKECSNHSKIYGIKLLNRDGTIQPSAGYFPTLARLAAQMLFIDDLPLIKRMYKPYQQNDINFYQKEQACDWVTGAFLLVSKQAFLSVNGYDESIFMYGEEIDLCYRLSKKGVTAKYNPSYSVFHLKGASSQDGFASAVVGEFKGLLTFYRKHDPKHVKLVKKVLWTGALLRILLFGMIRPKHVNAYRQTLKILTI